MQVRDLAKAKKWQALSAIAADALQLASDLRHTAPEKLKNQGQNQEFAAAIYRDIGLCYKMLGQYGKAAEVYEELALIDAKAIELYGQALGVANEGVEPRLRPRP
jgi:hypothetical protein